ncbi:MAG: transposase [Gammaproteobacteria bacterium]|nr:transposase [Gammaproteobacteria bacterium]
MESHYQLDTRFGRPARGNDKGKVEGVVGYSRRNFMVPMPRVSSLDELNVQLQVGCDKRVFEAPSGLQPEYSAAYARRSDLLFIPAERIF